MFDVETAQHHAFRIAARHAEELAFRAYNASVGLTYYGVAQANSFFRIAEDCAAREDYVGAWQAYGGAFLVIQENEKFSVLKRDEHGKIL